MVLTIVIELKLRLKKQLLILTSFLKTAFADLVLYYSYNYCSQCFITLVIIATTEMAVVITNKPNLQYFKTIVRLLKHITVSFNYLRTDLLLHQN